MSKADLAEGAGELAARTAGRAGGETPSLWGRLTGFFNRSADEAPAPAAPARAADNAISSLRLSELSEHSFRFSPIQNGRLSATVGDVEIRVAANNPTLGQSVVREAEIIKRGQVVGKTELTADTNGAFTPSRIELNEAGNSIRASELEINLTATQRRRIENSGMKIDEFKALPPGQRSNILSPPSSGQLGGFFNALRGFPTSVKWGLGALALGQFAFVDTNLIGQSDGGLVGALQRATGSYGMSPILGNSSYYQDGRKTYLDNTANAETNDLTQRVNAARNILAGSDVAAKDALYERISTELTAAGQSVGVDSLRSTDNETRQMIAERLFSVTTPSAELMAYRKRFAETAGVPSTVENPGLTDVQTALSNLAGARTDEQQRAMAERNRQITIERYFSPSGP